MRYIWDNATLCWINEHMAIGLTESVLSYREKEYTIHMYPPTNFTMYIHRHSAWPPWWSSVIIKT